MVFSQVCAYQVGKKIPAGNFPRALFALSFCVITAIPYFIRILISTVHLTVPLVAAAFGGINILAILALSIVFHLFVLQLNLYFICASAYNLHSVLFVDGLPAHLFHTLVGSDIFSKSAIQENTIIYFVDIVIYINERVTEVGLA